MESQEQIDNANLLLTQHRLKLEWNQMVWSANNLCCGIAAVGFVTSTAPLEQSPGQIERSEPVKVPEEFAFAAQFAVPYDNHHAAPCLACQHAFPLQPIVIVGQSAGPSRRSVHGRFLT